MKPITPFKIFLAITLFAFSNHAKELTRAELTANIARANHLIMGWEQKTSQSLSDEMSNRGLPGGPSEDFDLYLDNKTPNLRPYTTAEMRRDAATMELAELSYSHQGVDRYAGIFIESGAAWTGSYQWDTLHFIGFDEKFLRDRFLDLALQNKIFNIRVGIKFHELDPLRPDTLNAILDFHREAWRRGISLTDSVLFFSGLQKMESLDSVGNIDPQKSYQNNPEFPAFVESRSQFFLQALFREENEFNQLNMSRPPGERRPTARTAINPVNEPETFAGFNHFWNRGFAHWGDPNVMALYVPAIINIAKANLRIRRATLQAAKRRVLFFHNEAMTNEDYPSHQKDLQFAVSKLMLGDQDLMRADFKELASETIDGIRTRFEQNKKAGRTNIVEASILKYVSVPKFAEPSAQMAAKRFIINELRDLQNEHLQYLRETGTTAKADTILMLDYYQQSECALPQALPDLIHSLSENHGAKLKQALNVKSDLAFLNLLELYSHRTEAYTERPMWPGYKSIGEINFEHVLGQDDAILMDKIIGLRNDWTILETPEYEARRKAANFDRGWLRSNDEGRIDFFLNRLLSDDGTLLKHALGVSSKEQLFGILKDTGRAEGVVINETDSLEQIMNASERKIFHRLFGLARNRLVGFLPPHYARQARAQMRKGFDQIFMKYVDELGIRVGGIGESGTPYYPWAELVQKQMMISLARASQKLNFLIVRHDIGPAVGTIGWMNGPMTGDLNSNSRRGEDGIFKMIETGSGQYDYELSAWKDSPPWYRSYREFFRNGLRAQDSQR